MNQQREYRYDNIKFILIFLVIVGHGMELFMSGSAVTAYKIIYTFHMPAFLYVTGRYAKFKKGAIAKHLILPYFVFQTIYLIFDALVLKGTDIVLQYTTPYWILWYLFAAAVYYILLGILPAQDSVGRYIVLAGSVAVSLLTGFEKTIGYYMSLSRILIFAPFFLWGYYDRSIRRPIASKVKRRCVKALAVVLSVLLIWLGERHIAQDRVTLMFLYGSTAYEACGALLADRVIYLITAAAWIVLLEIIVPNIKIPFLSEAGRNTMPIFLMHAFVIRLAGKYVWFRFSPDGNLLLLCGMALILIAVLGNRYCGRLFRKLF